MAACVRLYKTDGGFIDNLICWRLESDFCHSTLEIDGVVYSATFPKVIKAPPTDKNVGIPPRDGDVYAIDLTDDEAAKAKAFCESMLGTSYDVLAMLGWWFRIQWMQRPNNLYCFEYTYAALAAAGIFPVSKRLVTGEQLLNDLFISKRVIDGNLTEQMTCHEVSQQQREPLRCKPPIIR